MKFLFPFILMISSIAWGKPVLEFMDLQTHMTMSFPYSIFKPSLKEGKPEVLSKLTYKHMFTNVIYKNFLAQNAGARIVINGALAFEYASDKEKIKKILLQQIYAVNEFALKNSNDFVVATTPAQVRDLVENTNKTIILHSIEGGNQIIGSQEDAHFWASQGVAFITLIHLVDDMYGGAAHNPDFVGKILNLKGTVKKVFHPHKKRGLTDHGKNAVEWLARAGVMTDMSHMSPESVTDTIEIFKRLNLPPLATHSLFAVIHKNDRAMTIKQLQDVYKLGGLFSLPISGSSVLPDDPDESFLKFIENDKICEGSLDSYRVSFQFVENFILKNVAEKKYSELTEDEKINYSIGWQSDFNGWLNHSRPRYGRNGCWATPSRLKLPELESIGLAHPGLLSAYWQTLEKEGMNVSSLKYSTEKFLRMWEKFLIFKETK